MATLLGELQALQAKRVDNRLFVAIDPPGLGDSGPPSSGYDTASIAKQIVDVLDVLSISNALLVGFDVGAWIGYALSARFPARFPRVALIDAAIPGLTPQIGRAHV